MSAGNPGRKVYVYVVLVYVYVVFLPKFSPSGSLCEFHMCISDPD